MIFHNETLSVPPPLLLVLLHGTCGRAQTFGPFTGDLIGLSKESLRNGYPDRPQTPDSIIGKLNFPRLDFLPRKTKENFPGITRADRFAFLLNSTLTIDSTGCYEFRLASDDGSRLWINDSLVINNDRPHKWTVKRDTQWLAAGDYPVRVWYYNAYVPIMGLALSAGQLGPEVTCESIEFTLSASALFAFGDEALQPSAYAGLDSLAAHLVGRPNRHVTVTGHTDARGDAAFNEALSLRRAEMVVSYLRSRLPTEVMNTIRFTTVGAGEREPVFDNDTVAGRAGNRRVVVLVE